MEHINLLRKIAWSFHKSTGLEWDELFQESYLAYRYALEHYDPNKGVPISSFIWTHISNQLRTYYQNEKKVISPLVGIEKLYNKEYNPTNFLESLSEDTKKVAELILIAPKKYVQEKPKDARKKVKKIMLNRGWSQERISYSLNELKVACSNS
jgi:DNA-directed RNA polymerase specialized sigma subunit